jgi:MoxR-like ATPase
MKPQTSLIRSLGIYGYDPVEPLILTALATGDPLLLVGAAGTGKTFLLNSLSEALGLVHRHYNASLISFDDLVGFPFPEPNGQGIRYLETPATVWGAESVLVDELSRCRPEHQNRFFSLIHERRLQGIALDRLRYRWAAMNPPALDDGSGYAGCEPLDPALADRFAFIINASDWCDLPETDRRAITDPRGEGLVSRDEGRLGRFLDEAKPRFETAMASPDPRILDYARLVTSALLDARIRLSPRRARQLARNLTGLGVVSPLPLEARLRLCLRWSLPQRATGEALEESAIDAAHQVAWEGLGLDAREQWLARFHRLPTLAQKTGALLRECPDPDTGSVAVTQLVAHLPPAESLAFALAVLPALLLRPEPPVGAEGLDELARLMGPSLDVSGTRTWFDSTKPPAPRIAGMPLPEWVHPGWARCQTVLEALPGPRRARAEVLFGRLFQLRQEPADPVRLEASLHAAVQEATEAVPKASPPPRRASRRKPTPTP